jgi:hypothetical protein
MNYKVYQLMATCYETAIFNFYQRFIIKMIITQQPNNQMESKADSKLLNFVQYLDECLVTFEKKIFM